MTGPAGLAGPADAVGVAAVQRRTLGVLVAAQSLGGLGTTIGIAVASVLAERITGSESLAGFVQTAQVLGAAAVSLLLARVMGRRGRRPGLAGGYLLGSLGGGVCVLGGAVGSYPLLVTGAIMLGSNTATSLASRYTAADLAAPAHRARSLSIVLWATTVGAVLGPNLLGPAGSLARALGLPTLTGPFLVSLLVTGVAGLVVLLGLRPDPLLLARRLAAAADAADEPAGTVGPAGPAGGGPAGGGRRLHRDELLALVRAHPGIPAAVLAMASAHAVMVAVMVMTPLHMDHGGAEIELIGLVISIHVLGMFFFSPLVGIVVDRLGPRAVLAGGALVLWLALLLSGSAPEGASGLIVAGLFLLGLGWSCCTVAAAALLVASTPLSHRTGVQGTADLLMNLAAAVAGVGGGFVVGALGYGWLNAFAALLVVGVAAAAVLARPRGTAPVRVTAP